MSIPHSPHSSTEVLPAEPTYDFATIPPSSNEPGVASRSKVDYGYGRGTLDTGLLLLRLVIGGTYLYLGLQKMTGWWGGRGVEGTKMYLEHHGWKHPPATGIALTAAEVGGGTLVIVGLVTPLAAAALLAVAINAYLWTQNAQHGIAFNVQSGIVILVLMGVGAAAIILTGPGRVSLDLGRGWATRPRIGSLLCLVIGIAGGVGGWLFLHGGNPLHG